MTKQWFVKNTTIVPVFINEVIHACCSFVYFGIWQLYRVLKFQNYGPSSISNLPIYGQLSLKTSLKYDIAH